MGETTHLTLLGRLRDGPSDSIAWWEFVARYGPIVERWCRQWGLQPADAQDVAQNVLVKLIGKLREYEHRGPGSFRRWLKTISRGVYVDLIRQVDRPKVTAEAVALEALEAPDDLAQRLEEEFDRELLEQAVLRVRERVQPHTWEAFRLTALEGLTGESTGTRLGMRVATVYVARGKVLRMIQEELRSLEEAAEVRSVTASYP